MNVKQLFDLTGRVAIITGGAAGLGLQMAEALSEMGANLVLCARKKARCEQAAKDFAAKGVKTLALACDVRNPSSIQETVDRTVCRIRPNRYPYQQRRRLLGRPGRRHAARSLEQSNRNQSHRHVPLLASRRQNHAPSKARKNHKYSQRSRPTRRSTGTPSHRLPRQQRRRDHLHEGLGMQVGRA